MVDSVAIVSGGMDSVTLLYHICKKLRKNPAVLTFTYGQKHDKEVAFAEYHAKELGCNHHLVIDLSTITPALSASALISADLKIPDVKEVKGDSQPFTYVPNRNMIFLSIAAAFAETNKVSDIYYGAQLHDLYGYWDTTIDFLERINSLLSLNRKSKVNILAPFVDYSKTEILREGKRLVIDFGKTWSCYKGMEKACGTCPTCAERLEAFRNLGIEDPIPYV